MADSTMTDVLRSACNLGKRNEITECLQKTVSVSTRKKADRFE